MFSFTFLIIIIGLKMIIPGLLRLKRIQYHLTIHLLHVDICKKKMTNYRSNWDRLLPICCHRELPSWICTNCARGVLNGNGWDPFLCIQAQELEVRSLYHLYSLKTKSSRCHYVVMTRSETKLSVAIPAPVSGQSAVNVATATSKCSITFLLPYDQDGDVKTKQDSVSNIL